MQPASCSMPPAQISETRRGKFIQKIKNFNALSDHSYRQFTHFPHFNSSFLPSVSYFSLSLHEYFFKHPSAHSAVVFLSWKKFCFFFSVAFLSRYVRLCPSFLAVTLHGPSSISPQHPSSCRERKKRKKSFPPLLFLPLSPSLSLSLIYNPGHRLVVIEESAVGPISRHKLLSVHDEMDWMENVYDFLCMKKPQGSVWSPPSPLSQELEKGGVLCFALLCRKKKTHSCARSSHLQLQLLQFLCAGQTNLFLFTRKPSGGKPP